MKTLDEIHDRIADAEDHLERRVPLTGFPVTIIRPGSYYLVASPTFSATEGNAITVTVSNVTIDLMGFAAYFHSGSDGRRDSHPERAAERDGKEWRDRWS